jgi:hypothetical protein
MMMTIMVIADSSRRKQEGQKGNLDKGEKKRGKKNSHEEEKWYF